MKRRTFFKTAAISGSAIAVTGLVSCQTTPTENEKTSSFSDFELNEITVEELQQKMQAGDFTSETICQKYLSRVEQLDPMLKSVIELNPDALEIARNLDEERKGGKIRGPLHGIPVMIKDNIDTGDKM